VSSSIQTRTRRDPEETVFVLHSEETFSDEPKQNLDPTTPFLQGLEKNSPLLHEIMLGNHQVYTPDSINVRRKTSNHFPILP
jgi:hypothetical protein